MNPVLTAAWSKLSDIQREAADWEDGALLVLAGPGSGKTQVLTCRIARLLDESPKASFRILALTFTNKAADEMADRVTSFAPGVENRATIATFHGFCAEVLRQHGVHQGIKPDFAIYALEADRKAVLEDALRAAAARGMSVSIEDVRFLSTIDRLKSRLIDPDNASTLARTPDNSRAVMVYEIYEAELRKLNALDYSSLIFEAYRLMVAFPAIAARYRRSYTHWLVDEFQDTTDGQFRLLRAMSGTEFKNLFAVADDDQIIYHWNGASFKQLQRFRADFQAAVKQLPTNYRCPPAIVEAANRLVAYNVQRTSDKKPLIAGKTDLKLPREQHIQIRVFPTDQDEADGVAQEISERDRSQWGQIAVLARTRALLERMLTALQHRDVAAVIAQRRDDFLSPEFRWLVACLKQIGRPLDRRNMATLVEAFNRMSGTEFSLDEITASSEVTGKGYLATWLDSVTPSNVSPHHRRLAMLADMLVKNPGSAKTFMDDVLDEIPKHLADTDHESDLTEDQSAWQEISRDIARHLGQSPPIDQFLQELQLRSKEPSPRPNTVTLMTIHGAKGREFDVVYLLGLAEDIIPSFQSKKKGETSAEMEEERRNCFVAITRAKECLILSRADKYRGWEKEPSRFLVEMGLVG